MLFAIHVAANFVRCQFLAEKNKFPVSVSLKKIRRGSMYTLCLIDRQHFQL